MSHSNASTERGFSRLIRRLAAVAACLTVSLVSAQVAAQEDGGEADPLNEELENYWSVERDLPVVQEKLYQRGGRFGIGLYAGLMSSEPFWWYVPVGGRLSYFFTDTVGVEVGGQFMDAEGALTHDTEITDFLKSDRGDAIDPELHFEDRMKWRANATLVWNPFYGKWSFLNNKLSHFEFNFVAGGGVVAVQRPDLLRQNSESTIAPEGVLGTGFHFYLSEDFLLRADGRMYIYQGAETPSTEDDFFAQLQVPTEFLLGASYMF